MNEKGNNRDDEVRDAASSKNVVQSRRMLAFINTDMESSCLMLLSRGVM